MTKFYIYEQAGQYWNRTKSQLVSLSDATVYTEQEFLNHTMYLDDLSGTWLEISNTGFRSIKRRAQLVDDMVRAMRKWDRERLMDFVSDNLDNMVRDDMLPTMYGLVMQEPRDTVNVFDTFVNNMDGRILDDNMNRSDHGKSPLSELLDIIG